MGDEKAADLRRKRRPIDGREEVVATPDAPEFHSTAAARGEGLTVGCRHRRIVCAQDDQRGTAAEVSHRAKTISGRVLPASEPAEALAKDARARWVVSEDAAKSREGRDRPRRQRSRDDARRSRAPTCPRVEKPPAQTLRPRSASHPAAAARSSGHARRLARPVEAPNPRCSIEATVTPAAARRSWRSSNTWAPPQPWEKATPMPFVRLGKKRRQARKDRLVAQVHREHHARWAAFAPGVAFRNFSNR